jgi:type II restriction enzyme
MSEQWLIEEIYCPACGGQLVKHPRNTSVRDAYCIVCNAQYELKAKKTSLHKITALPPKIVDGAYSTMMQRMASNSMPHLFFLQYLEDYTVASLMVIPKPFFMPTLIEKRPPLSQHARRSGWVGCNILLETIPEMGRIPMISDQILKPKAQVIQTFKKSLFLEKITNNDTKGWLLDVIRCIEWTNKKEFTLRDLYQYETLLRQWHPQNNHIPEKIRQQLQILRDSGFLISIRKGVYQVI